MMLQRVAGNAYSWWWASHIRTKQSKWLEQNLNDMEDKVSNMLEIIDNDGDSFAQRANMYYRKRPELLVIVEDTYRAYRALAERFDHISKDLQSANRTIATVCPDQVPFSMPDEDEENGGLASTSTSLNKPGSRVPLPKKDFRSQSMLLLRKGQLKKAFTSAQAASCPASGLNKEEALEEIDKLQKEILEMQTEWEFVKNSYEQGYKKLCEIETNITEKQKRVCSLQDEYDIGTAIDDNEARRLMANRVLQSCQESLVKLQETHEQSTEEGRAESKRIKKVNETFEALRKKYNPPQTNQQEKLKRTGSAMDVDNMVYEFDSEEKEKEFMTSLRKDIEQKLEVSSSSSLTMSQLGEKIDDLVQRVVNLESAVFSENASVKRLKTDANELQEHVQSLEKDEETLVGGSDNTNQRICALEGELSRVKDVLKAIIDHNNSLKAHFTEASCNINHLSVNLHAVEMDEEVENTRLSEEAKTEVDAKPDSKTKESSTLKDIGIEMEGKDKGVSAEGRNNVDSEPSNMFDSVLAEGRNDVDSEPSNKFDSVSAEGRNDVDSEPSNKFDAVSAEGRNDVDSGPSNKFDSVSAEERNDVDSEPSNKFDSVSAEGRNGVDSEASNKIDVVSAERRNNVDSEASNKIDDVDSEASNKIDDVDSEASNKIEVVVSAEGRNNVDSEASNKIDDVDSEASNKIEVVVSAEGRNNVDSEASNKIDDVDSEASNKIDDVDSEASNKIDDVDSEASNKIDDVDSEASNKIDVVSAEASNKIDVVVSAEGRDTVDSEASNKIDVVVSAEGRNNVDSEASNKIDDVDSEASNKIDDVDSEASNKIDVVSAEGRNNVDSEASNKIDDVDSEASNKIDDVDSEASNKIDVVSAERSNKFDVVSAEGRDNVDSEASNKIDDVDSEASNKIDDVDSEASNKIDVVSAERSNKFDVVSAEGRDNVDSEASNKFDVNSEKDPPPVNEYKAEKAIDTEAESDEEEAQPNWKKLYMRGLDDRERILLDEYSSVLRNYKNVRKKLKQVDKKNRDSFYELALQIRELKNALAARDEEIQSLRRKSGFIDENRDGNLTEYEASYTMTSPESSLTDYIETSPVAASEGKGEAIEKVGMQERSLTPSRSIPTVEDRIRTDIDELLEENLAFWLRFSTSFHQIQKYQTSVQDLKSDLSSLKERKQESSGKEEPLGSEARPIYAHFREIRTELTLWLENNAVLKDEVQCRYTSLCNIHEEIVRMSSVNGHERDPEINRYQAAKFQGEILNMKQENIKVSKELKAGFDRVQQLKQEVENVMANLQKEIEAATSRNQHSGTKTRSRIPLRSFLFGIKLKNKWQQKGPSMFACASPQLQRQYSYLTEPEEPS